MSVDTFKRPNIVGNSPALRRMLAEAARLAPLDVPILVVSKDCSGDGKTELARAIHVNSKRASGPLVHVSLASMPDEIIWRELAGSASDSPPRVGRIQEASGGTLLLEHIGEASVELQAQLFQLFSTGNFVPVGSTATRADVRLIAESHRDLRADAAEWRLDSRLVELLYRHSIVVPTLHERREDIAAIARECISRSSARYRCAVVGMADEVQPVLEARDWWGGVRKLSCVCERAVILAAQEGSRTVEVRHLGVSVAS